MTPVLVSKEKNEVTFTMAFTAEEFDGAIDKAYKANRDKFVVDGFRRGKAPRKMIEARYGEEIFFEDALDELFGTGYPQSLSELELHPVDRPSLDFGDEKLEKGKELKVTVKVTVEPEITVKDYKGVAVEKINHIVTDEDVNGELAARQKRNARLVVAERPAEVNDTVGLDYSGFVGDEQFEGGTAENQTLVLGSGTFIPGFEDQLIGASAGDEKDVKVTFPEDYHEPKLAGKEAVFKCKIHDVKYQQLPELDDEFAKDISDFDTLEELKNDIKAGLEKTASEASEYQAKDAVMSKVFEANPIEVPQIMIDDQAAQMLQEFGQQLSYQGLNLKLYCQYLQKTEEDIKKEFLPDAEKKVKTQLIVKAVAKQENIEATDEDIAKEMEAMAKQYNMEVEKLKGLFDAENSEYLLSDIKMRKAIDLMYNSAVITEKDEEPEAPKAE